MKQVVFVGLLTLFPALLLPAAGVASDASSQAPDFTLSNIEGAEVNLAEMLEEGPVLLDFWATWCKPCIKAFPELQEIFDKYRECGLKVVTVALDGPRSSSRVAPLVKSKGHDFEVLLDTSGRVAKKYHVKALPRTVIISAEGEMVYGHTGYRPGQQKKLEEIICTVIPEDCEPGAADGADEGGDSGGTEEESVE